MKAPLSKIHAAGLLVLATLLVMPTARAGMVLWYNGDYDNRDSLTNENNVPINTGAGYALQTSLVYDDFVVPVGQIWTIDSVFSNNQIAYAVPLTSPSTTATWEILSGVSAGNGGSVVASGDTAATATAVTPVGGFFYGDPEYTISAAVSGVTLSAGTYWLAVAPDSAGYFGDQSYIETTSGANAVGIPPGDDGDSFVTNTFPPSGDGAYDFTPTTTALAGDGDGPNIDFSMGITGTETDVQAVPEPATLMMVGESVLAAAAFAFVRRRRLSAARVV